MIGHPVTWVGRLISSLDHFFNRDCDSPRVRRFNGFLAVVLFLGLTGLVAQVFAKTIALLPLLIPAPGPFGTAGVNLVGAGLCALAASTCLAQRSLDTHVRAVAGALERHGLSAGRQAVARIVGRNVDTLDEAGIARAAIESLAENFSDGIVAPAFWIGLGGLSGGLLYKAINTADSMIGHRNERFAAFGYAAARLDDLVNLPASRLAALCLCLAAPFSCGTSPGAVWRIVRRDANGHPSPNAGWPEAAAAGALGLQLGGPRMYADKKVEDSWIGNGRRGADARDIRRALRLYRCACGINFCVSALPALLLIMLS